MATWQDPKTDWDSSQQGVGNDDFNRIEGNIEFLGERSPITDVDGNTYQTTVINGLQWTVDNWKSTKYADGTAIPLVSDGTAWAALSTPAYCKYDGFITQYGLLYNWYTIDPANINDLAPDGWRVATAGDFIALDAYLAANGYTHDLQPGGGSGERLASSVASTRGWQSVANDGAPGENPYNNNSSGIAISPAGYRDSDGTFYTIGQQAYLLVDNEASKFGYIVAFSSDDIVGFVPDPKLGMSIKMVRDV